jgi:acetolactate decarboxylase
MRIPCFILIASAALLAGSKSYDVKWVGEMRKVMMMGEDKGIISLDSLKDKAHLYALGPVEGLNGEITVFDSEPFIATIRDGKPFIEKKFHVRAPLLVYVQVAKWTPIAIPSSVKSLPDLDKFVAASARKAGLEMTAPFPFRVTGHAQEIQMHIVNRQGRDATGREAHEAIEVKIPLNDVMVELIGFWSDRHGGIFTHMGSNTHVHGRTTDNKVSGHVDSFRIESGELWLPAGS